MQAGRPTSASCNKPFTRITAFLFENISSEAFDAAADKLYHAMPDMQEHECLAGLTRMVASIRYGHTALPWRDSKLKYHTTPINFYWFADRLYVEGTTKDNAAILARQDRESGINAHCTNGSMPSNGWCLPKMIQFFKARGLDYLGIPEALHAQEHHKNPEKKASRILSKKMERHSRKQSEHRMFSRRPAHMASLKTEKDWIAPRDTTHAPLWLKHPNRIYFYEYLPDSKTVYVRHSQIQNEPGQPISGFYKELYGFIENNDVERLVLDVRLNGGGNNYLNKPIITGLIETKKINKPGKFFVIIGRRTFSACQNLVNEFSNYTNAVFVGEPSSENINFYGDNNRIVLPNTTNYCAALIRLVAG